MILDEFFSLDLTRFATTRLNCHILKFYSNKIKYLCIMNLFFIFRRFKLEDSHNVITFV